MEAKRNDLQTKQIGFQRDLSEMFSKDHVGKSVTQNAQDLGTNIDVSKLMPPRSSVEDYFNLNQIRSVSEYVMNRYGKLNIILSLLFTFFIQKGCFIC